jgi:hypothetical protein
VSSRRAEVVVADIVFNMSVYGTGGEIEDIVSNNIAQHVGEDGDRGDDGLIPV